MAVLDSDMRRVVLEQKLGFVATVCPDGTPNLSPKGTTTVWDDEHVLFADIRSPQTVRNLATRPVVEINVVDPITRKGYRFKGRATLHSDDEIYEQGLALLAERGYEATPERVRTIVLVRVERAAPLISPAYDGGATEEIVSARWERHLTEVLKGRGRNLEIGRRKNR
jgi:predicted pyridoxine 5'-phosphate oxidase superfamily flavin-nucleotide-binding protein